MHFYGLKKRETSYTYILLLLYHCYLRCFSIKKGFHIIFQVFFNVKEMSTDYCSIMHGESVNFPSSTFGWSVPNLVMSYTHCRTPRPALALLSSPRVCFHTAVTVRILTTFFVRPSTVCCSALQSQKWGFFFLALSMTERWILYFSCQALQDLVEFQSVRLILNGSL